MAYAKRPATRSATRPVVALTAVALALGASISGTLAQNQGDGGAGPFAGLRSWVAEQVTQKIAHQLGVAVQVSERADLDLMAAAPTVTVRDLRIAAPEWSPEPWFLEATTATFDLSWRELVRLRTVPRALTLEDAVFHLRRAADGTGTWPAAFFEFGDADDGLNQITIQHGTAFYSEADDPRELVLHLDGALLLGEGPHGRQWNADVAVNGAGPGLAMVGRLIGLDLPESSPMVLHGQLTRDGRLWRLSEAQGTFGGSDVMGRLEVHEATEEHPTTVQVASHSATLWLPDAPGVNLLMNELADAPVGDPAGVLPRAAVPVEALHGWDLFLTITADRASGGPVPVTLHDLALQIRLRDGHLVIDPLEAFMPDGQGGAFVRAELNAAVSPPYGELEVEARRVALPLPGGGESGPAGYMVGGASLTVSGRGQTVRDLLATAEGDGVILVSGGALEQGVLAQVGLGFDDVFGFLAPNTPDGSNPIRCAAARFEIAKGVAHLPAFILDTNEARVVGQGWADLRTETLSLDLDIDPDGPQVLAWHGPIGLRGPWTNPALDLDAGEMAARGAVALGLAVLAGPLAALVPFLDPGLGEDSGCHQVFTQQTVETP